MLQGVVGEAEVRGPLDMDHISVDRLEAAAGDLDGDGIIGIELHQAFLTAVTDEAGSRKSEGADIAAVQRQETGGGAAVIAGGRRPSVQQFITRQDLAELVIAVRIVERIPVRGIVRTGEIDISILNALHRILAAPVPLGQDNEQSVALGGGDILFLGLHLAQSISPVHERGPSLHLHGCGKALPNGQVRETDEGVIFASLPFRSAHEDRTGTVQGNPEGRSVQSPDIQLVVLVVIDAFPEGYVDALHPVLRQFRDAGRKGVEVGLRGHRHGGILPGAQQGEGKEKGQQEKDSLTHRSHTSVWTRSGGPGSDT